MYQYSAPEGQLSQVPEAALKRAEREAFQHFLRDCEGIRLLRSLSREKLNWYDQETLLERRLKEMPKIFERRRALKQLVQALRARQVSLDDFATRSRVLFNDCRECPPVCALKQRIEQSLRIGQLAPDEFSRRMPELLDACIRHEYKFPPGYALQNEQTETANARCALSEFKWRNSVEEGLTPSQPRVSRTDCGTVANRLCATRQRLSAVRRELQNKKEQIDSQRRRLDRLLCDRWPSDARRPPDHSRWCAEIKAKIQQFEQELSQLTATAGTLDDELFSIAHEYAAAGCEDFPGCLVGQP